MKQVIAQQVLDIVQEQGRLLYVDDKVIDFETFLKFVEVIDKIKDKYELDKLTTIH